MGYKHMSNIYENPDLRFSEIKDIFIQASEGRLEGTEKTDGQNMLVSYSVVDKEAKAARNNSMLSGMYSVKGEGKVRLHAPGGVNATGWAEKWADHPSKSVRAAFVEAFEIFEKAARSLTPDEQEEVFGDGVNYLVFFNCEVQDPRNMNTIRYDKKTLTVHRVGHLYVDLDDGSVKDVDVTRNALSLQDSLRTMQKSVENTEFALEINAIRQLKALSNKKPLKNALSALESIIDKEGISDSQTVGDYTISRLLSVIRPYAELPEDKEKMLLKKILGHKGLNINLVKKDLSPEQKEIVTKLYKDRRSLLNNAIRPLENVIHDFAVEMLKGLESAFVLDQKEEIERLRREVAQKRKEIEASGDQTKIDLLLRHFEKIKELDNISSAAEGFVFDYNGMTYKFTGNFAPINQILGIGKYDRGPSTQPPVGESPLTLQEEPVGRLVALIPGKFKPPHRGHLNMVKHYAKIADVVKVLVSPLPAHSEDKTIELDAEDSITIWNVYIRDSGLVNVEVMRSPMNSPVQASFDFVANKEDKPEWAQPGDSIILGASTKGGDESRFAGDVQKYAREGVEVLNPMEYVFDPPEETPFNASDVRNALAAEDEIIRFIPDECIKAGSEPEIISILIDKPEKKTNQITSESLYSLVESVMAEKHLLNEASLNPANFLRSLAARGRAAAGKIKTNIDTHRRREEASENAYILLDMLDTGKKPEDIVAGLKDWWSELDNRAKKEMVEVINSDLEPKISPIILEAFIRRTFFREGIELKIAVTELTAYLFNNNFRRQVEKNPLTTSFKGVKMDEHIDQQNNKNDIYFIVEKICAEIKYKKPKTKKDRDKVSRKIKFLKNKEGLTQDQAVGKALGMFSSDSLEEEELEEISSVGGTVAQPTGNIEGHAGPVKKRKRTKPSLIRGEG